MNCGRASLGYLTLVEQTNITLEKDSNLWPVRQRGADFSDDLGLRLSSGPADEQTSSNLPSWKVVFLLFEISPV